MSSLVNRIKMSSLVQRTKMSSLVQRIEMSSFIHRIEMSSLVQRIARTTERPLLLSIGRVPYGIRRYSTRCVRHDTITHVGTVQQSGDVTKSERYKNREGA